MNLIYLSDDVIRVYIVYDFVIYPKHSQLRCTKILFNPFLLLISVCLRTVLTDYCHDLFPIYLHETLVLLLFHTYFSLLPSDIICGYNFCSLKETDQKLRLEGHIVILILIFLLIRIFQFHIPCADFIPLFNFHSCFCVASLVTTLQGFQTLTTSVTLLAQDNQKLCGGKHCFVFQRSQFRYSARGQLSLQVSCGSTQSFLEIDWTVGKYIPRVPTSTSFPIHHS